LKTLYSDVDWQPVVDVLQQADCIHVVAHVNPDADTIGSQLALYHALKAMGKSVFMHNIDVTPRICRYLSGVEHITYGSSVTQAADVVVAVDAGSLARLGMDTSYYEGKTLLNIDHHASNRHYGDVNLVDARYCATGAMVYDLLPHLGVSLNDAIAAAIYAAVLTDTASFRLSSVTADVHRMVASLIDAGADVDIAAQAIYQSHKKERFDLLREALKNLKLCHQGKTAWMSIDGKTYQHYGMTAEDSEGFIDYVRSIEGVCIAVFIREESADEWKVSFRGKAPYHVGELASSLGGGGHQYAAGCTMHGSLSEVYEKLQQSVSDILEAR
jgi:phosphoesterase RecJ-like protein